MQQMNFSWLIEGEVAGHGGPASEHDLRFLISLGIAALVRLQEKHLALVTPEQVKQVGMDDLHVPTPDFGAPTMQKVEQIIHFMTASAKGGKPVGVSCEAGRGRTGTILACYLVSKGWSSDKALHEVRSKRPGSVETKKQETAVRRFEEYLQPHPG